MLRPVAHFFFIIQHITHYCTMLRFQETLHQAVHLWVSMQVDTHVVDYYVHIHTGLAAKQKLLDVSKLAALKQREKRASVAQSREKAAQDMADQKEEEKEIRKMKLKYLTDNSNASRLIALKLDDTSPSSAHSRDMPL